MKLRDWSIRRWLLLIAAIILLPLVGLRLHMKWRVHRAVEAWRDAGHPVSKADLAERQASLPLDDNAFFLLTNAYALLIEPRPPERSLISVVGDYSDELLELHGWLEPIKKATDTYLQRQQAGLDLAVLAVERPVYWEPVEGATDQGVSYRLLAKMISLKLRHELQGGNREEAIRWLVVQCRLGCLRAGGGTDFNSQMGGAVLRMALENIAQLL